MSEEKGANRLDRSSTDAMHWAECFCEQARISSDNLEDGKSCSQCFHLDSSVLVGWFANYWAAVNDPLQSTIESLLLEHSLALASKDNAIRELEARLSKSIEVGSVLQNAVLAVYQDLSNKEGRYSQLSNASYLYEKHHDFIRGVGKHITEAKEQR